MSDKVDLECLAAHLDEMRRAATPEARLKAADLFASRMQESRPRLSEQSLARLRGEIEQTISVVQQDRDDLAERIRLTASSLGKLRRKSKCALGGLGSGTKPDGILA